MSRELAEKAWNKVKDKNDPEFTATAPDHQRNLESAAADVIATGVTVNNFERAVKEFSAKAAEAAPKSALGTTNAIGEEPVKAEKADEASKQAASESDAVEPFEHKTRAELDELAAAKGLKPEDYKNKAEIIAALEKE